MIEFPVESLRADLRKLEPAEIVKFINQTYPIKQKKNKVFQSQIPVELGIVGEKDILEIINESNLGFKAERISQKHSGDIIMWRNDYPNIKIMIEVKNYTNRVSKEQYDKFLSDLHNTQVAGGIFLTNKPVCGHQEFEILDNIMLLVADRNKQIMPLLYLFWHKQIIEKHFMFISKQPIIKNYHMRISNSVAKIVLVKNSVKSIRKSVMRELETIDNICSEVMRETSQQIDELNKLTAGDQISISTEGISLPDDKNFFINSHQDLRERLLKFLDTMFIGKPLCSQKSGKNEISISGTCRANSKNKEIHLKFYKLKLAISFKPRMLDFTQFESDIKYENGLVTFSIDKNNHESDILEKISDLI